MPSLPLPSLVGHGRVDNQSNSVYGKERESSDSLGSGWLWRSEAGRWRIGRYSEWKVLYRNPYLYQPPVRNLP
jgi:hypothetical protein